MCLLTRRSQCLLEIPHKSVIEENIPAHKCNKFPGSKNKKNQKKWCTELRVIVFPCQECNQMGRVREDSSSSPKDGKRPRRYSNASHHPPAGSQSSPTSSSKTKNTTVPILSLLNPEPVNTAGPSAASHESTRATDTIPHASNKQGGEPEVRANGSVGGTLNGKLFCFNCQQEFSNFKKLRQHLREVESRFPCNYKCDKDFPNENLRSEHQVQDHGSYGGILGGVIQCFRCCTKFERYKSLIVHLERQEGRFGCNAGDQLKCDIDFPDEDSRTRHLLEIHELVPCCKRCYNKDGYVNHVNKCHGNDDNKNLNVVDKTNIPSSSRFTGVGGNYGETTGHTSTSAAPFRSSYGALPAVPNQWYPTPTFRVEELGYTQNYGGNDGLADPRFIHYKPPPTERGKKEIKNDNNRQSTRYYQIKGSVGGYSLGINKVTRYWCSQCDLHLRSRLDLVEHMVKHSDSPRWGCKIKSQGKRCQRDFLTKEDLEIHQTKTHDLDFMRLGMREVDPITKKPIGE